MELVLQDTSPTPKFPLLLQHASPRLKKLTLVWLPSFDPLSDAPYPLVDAIITRFDQLTYLNIDGPFCSDALFDNLSPLLECLTLGSGADVSSKRLLALVQGPAKHTSLQELHLDIVQGVAGTSAEGNDIYKNPETGRLEVFPDWQLPE